MSAINLLQKSLDNKQSLIIFNSNTVHKLTGFKASFSVLIITKSKTIICTDQRYEHLESEFEIHLIKKLIPDLQTLLTQNQIKEVILDFNSVKIPLYLKLCKKFTCKNINQEQADILLQKNKSDLLNLKTAIAITEQTLSWCLARLSPAMKEVEFQRVLKTKAIELGADDFAFQPIVAFGKNTANIHHNAGSTILGNKPIMLIDLGFKYKNMCSDMTRTYIMNLSATKIIDSYQAVFKAKQEAEKLYLCGKNMADAAQKANDILKKTGHDQIPHSLGHGIGSNVHEAPSVSHLSKDKFPHDTFITCEPGTYIKNHYGIRLEDIIHIQKDQSNNLNQLAIEYKSPLLKHLQRTE